MIRPDQPLSSGTRIENFQIERMIGRGGFGVTYLATEFARSADLSRGSEFQRQVAIKEYFPSGLACRDENSRVIPAQIADTDVAYFNGLKAFLREANTIAQLDHQNVVRIHSAFESHGTAYFVMPFLRGVTLKAVIKRRGQLSQDEIERLIMPVLDGLDEVHGLGIVHRDIKPENIVVLDSNERPVLIDFGAAREKSADDVREYTRMSEFVAYTPGYAPFEQYSRATSGNRHEVQVDIYAVCATLYTCVTGSAPPESSARSQEILSRRPDPMVPASKVETAQGSIAPELLAAIDWGLQLVPEDRPASVAQLRDAMLGQVHNPHLSGAQSHPVPVVPVEDDAPTRLRESDATVAVAEVPDTEPDNQENDATRLREPPAAATEIYVLPGNLSERIVTERAIEATRTTVPATQQGSDTASPSSPAATTTTAEAADHPGRTGRIAKTVLAVMFMAAAVAAALFVWPELQARSKQKAASELAAAESFLLWIDTTLDQQNAPENLLDSAHRMLERGQEHLSNRELSQSRQQSAASRDKAYYVASEFLRGVRDDYSTLARSQLESGEERAASLSLEKSRRAEQGLAELEARR